MMTKGEHTNECTYIRTHKRTGQTLYPLHNFVVRGDNQMQMASGRHGRNGMGELGMGRNG